MENLAVGSAPGAATQNKPKNLHGTETILLGEDHDSIRELTRRCLAELERPDLAVLGVVMPHMAAAATQLLHANAGIPDSFYQRLFGEC